MIRALLEGESFKSNDVVPTLLQFLAVMLVVETQKHNQLEGAFNLHLKLVFLCIIGSREI